MNYKPEQLLPEEQRLLFALNKDDPMAKQKIGHVRGDFDRNGTGFFTTWFPCYEDLKSERISVDKAGICPFNEGSCNFDERTHAVFPLFYASERIGTLICTHDGECDELYLSLCKMLALLCSIAVYNEKKAVREKEARRKSAAVQAVASLSYTERAAARAMLASLAEQADEKGVAAGLLNASTVAREYGITRSVIASALKKLEGAGVITVRSLGMKGSYIALINPCVTEMLAKEDEIGGGDV